MPFNLATTVGATAAGAALLTGAVLLGGSAASADVDNLETRVASGTANATSIKSLAVACPSGKVALGGGFSFSNPGADVTVVTSAPSGATGDGSDNGTGWLAEFNNHEAVAKTVYVWVVCGLES